MNITLEVLNIPVGTGAGAAHVQMDAAGAGSLLLANGYGIGESALEITVDGAGYGGFNVDDEPSFPGDGVAGLYIMADGDGYGASYGDGVARLTLEARGFYAPANYGVGEAGLLLGATGAEAGEPTGYIFSVLPPFAVSIFGGLWFARGFSAMQLSSDDLHGNPVAVLRAALATSTNASSSASVTQATADEISFGQALGVVWKMLLEEGITLGGTATEDAQKIARVVARLVLSGEVDTYAQALAAITAGLVFGSLTDLLRHERMTEQVQLNALAAELFTAVEQMLDRAVIEAAAQGMHTMVVMVSEGMTLTSAPSSAAEFAALVREGIGFFMTLALDDGHYVAWVMNTDSRGLSRYTNYPFNSFMEVGGVYYGVTSTGLYRLTGGDDSGTPIAARLRMGMSDLGTRKLKRIPEGFIGYTSDGTLLLQVITSDEETGEKVGAYYTLAPRGAANVRENRWKIGRGLKSVDWDFEITNVDGADFEIDAIAWRPLILDRRTRG